MQKGKAKTNSEFEGQRKSERRGGDFGQGGWARQQKRAIDSEGRATSRCLKRASKSKTFGGRQTECAAFPTGPRKAKDDWPRRAKRNWPHRPPKIPTLGRLLAARCFAKARPNARKGSAGQKNGCEGGGGKARWARGREGRRNRDEFFHPPLLPPPARAGRRARANRLSAA